MAGPNGDDNHPVNNKQTGTRPKSRTSTNVSRNPSLSSGVGSHQALVTLMREYQAVSDSLALAREQIEREGQRGGHNGADQGGRECQEESSAKDHDRAGQAQCKDEGIGAAENKVVGA